MHISKILLGHYIKQLILFKPGLVSSFTPMQNKQVISLS